MTKRWDDRSAAAVLWPLVVFAAVAAVALAGFLVVRAVAAEQDRQLLGRRHAEVGALLQVSVVGIESSLRALAAVESGADPGEGHAFVSAASAIRSESSTAVGVLRRERNGIFHVDQAIDFGIAQGGIVDEQRATIAERALASGELAAGVFTENDVRVLMLAVPADGSVVFEEIRLDPDQPLARSPDSPYWDLRVALYASNRPDPDAVVLTTEEITQLPLRGAVLREPFDVGGEPWTLAVSARRPLAGSLTARTPWLLLTGGLISAGMAAAVTATLARRRSYALALVADRTADYRHAKEEADRANRSKSDFLSRMSHELRTPLNAVLGFGQILEMDDLTPAQRDAVAHIRKGGEHLLSLINEVLDISRVETGTISLSPEAVQIGEVVAESVDLIRPLAEQRAIQLATDRTGTWDHYVFADRQRTKQIVLNLLSNAVKYNRQRGTVAVACTAREPGWIRVSVSDTGPGIRAEDVDLVFMPFERLGAEVSGVEGAGIGLALSRSLAEAMGGTLTVDSLPGRGSTFILDLPAVEGPVERYDRLNGGRGAHTTTRPGGADATRVVLHIEDNLSNLTLVERIVEQRPGVSVIAAMQGRLGVELAHEHRPKLILLDLHLPDMSGEEVLHRLRDDPALASTPVVIVSADATPGHVQRLLTAGAAAYLTKPFEVRELLRLLDEALERP